MTPQGLFQQLAFGAKPAKKRSFCDFGAFRYVSHAGFKIAPVLEKLKCGPQDSSYCRGLHGIHPDYLIHCYGIILQIAAMPDVGPEKSLVCSILAQPLD